MNKAILFDLDGTLLPMNLDAFLSDYFERLTAYMAKHGYEPKQFGKAIWSCIGAMLGNDGGATNEKRFWDAFAAIYAGERDVYADRSLFEAFYREEFAKIGAVCGKNPEADRLTADLCALGVPIVLATNPLFPRIATEQRIAWAGIHPARFTHITTYENATYAKPSVGYYREIASFLGIRPENCMMVGNDTEDDGSALEAGMQVFILTDCLINKRGIPMGNLPHGDFAALRKTLAEFLSMPSLIGGAG